MIGRRTQFALLVCVLLAAGAGCTAISSGEMSADQLLEELEESEPPEELQATVEVNTTFEGETMGIVYDVWYGADGQMRTEGSIDGDRIVEVSDGETAYFYEPAENEVRTREVQNDESPIEGIQAATTEMLETQEVAEISRTEFDGREAYRVVLDEQEEANQDDSRLLPPLLPSTAITGDEPAEGGDHAEDTRVELWIDAEHKLVLGQEMYEQQFEMRYTDVEVDPGLSDELFEFEVPENATVEEIQTPDFQEFDSIDEAEKAVAFEVPEPAFTGFDAELERTYVVSDEASEESSVTQEYVLDDGIQFSVSVRDHRIDREADGEQVSVAGTVGVYEPLSGGAHQVTWRAGEFEFTALAERELDRETLLELAGSIEMP